VCNRGLHWKLSSQENYCWARRKLWSAMDFK
jgi:hypothetical protein